MFESDLQPFATTIQADSSTAQLIDAPQTADAYGLQVSATKAAMGNGAPLLELEMPASQTGKTLSVGGTLLIQGGNTTTTEINEVNNLLNSSRYDRDDITGMRTYTNYKYQVGDPKALQSANENVGVDRGDYLTNAIGVGTVVYRSGAKITGNIGLTYSNIRDVNDYYSFYLGKSGTIDLQLNGLSKDVGLALYNAEKQLVSWSDKEGNSSELISKELSKGAYYARVYSYPQPFAAHGATGYQLTIERQADALEDYWQTLLADNSVENAALNSIKYDNHLSRTDIIGTLKSAGDYGSVTSTELTDLRNFYNVAINTPYVATASKVLSHKVLFDDDSNQWYTGSDSIRDDLGNLASGSSTDHLNLLIGKHFLGTDRPAIHRDQSNNLAGSYTSAGGNLFVNGASVNDVRQGATGDCYFLSALGSTANDKNSAITDMFHDNGDGTWTVRFYTNGKLDYVTVDRMMPTDSYGNYIYANDGQSVAGNNELWVALAEKAYAQVNESGRIGQDGNNFYGDGNDNGIGWGFSGTSISHITNLTTMLEKLTPPSVFGWSSYGLDQTELINLVNSNRIVTIDGFNLHATNSNNGTTSISTAVQEHSYSITNYNAATERFTIRNPWGNRHLSLTFGQLLTLGGTINYSLS
jgi:hypothetical protein